ncbi:aldo/keto reductase [Photobacterium kasasachensis]|uniref:aldo/keto reductase n=1 Tax=Photobacterium kasasachensis TaxID=2910240 RepID=UPI003D115095
MTLSNNQTLPLANYLANTSRLAFGCMGLIDWDTHIISNEQQKFAEQAIESALDAGITLFDHADIYCKGKAEEVFGNVLKYQPGLRDKIYLQSKVGIRPASNDLPGRYDFSSQWLTHSIEGSLKRLNTDYLDVYFLHRPDPLMQPEAVAEVFHQLHDSGKVRHFAVSNMQQHQIAFLQTHLNLPIIANQIEMSLFHIDWLEEGVLSGQQQGIEVNFTAGTLEYCRQHKIQLQAWGSLAQGIFSGKKVKSPTKAIRQTSELVARLAAEYATSKEAIVLAWLQRHPANIQPVIGTCVPSRIKACAQAEQVTLSREHWYALYISARGEALP